MQNALICSSFYQQNRLKSLLKTSNGLQINGLTEAFKNFNEEDCDYVVARKSRFDLPDNLRRNRVNMAKAKTTPVRDASAYPFGDSEKFEDKMDKKEPDWSDNDDENDCVRVYLVSEDDENLELDQKVAD